MSDQWQSAEGVFWGHPDYLADLISDTVVDAFLENNPHAHVGCETVVSSEGIFLFGETNVLTPDNLEEKIHFHLEELLPFSYHEKEYKNLPFNCLLHKQSNELRVIENTPQDQSIITGYACNETAEKIPFSLFCVRQILSLFKTHTSSFPFVREDGKVLVVVNPLEKKIHRILCSLEHTKETPLELLRNAASSFLKNNLDPFIDERTEFFINPLGLFTEGGILSDTGLSGRKQVFSSYGPKIPLGGGAMTGKDPLKVDRWGAYLARAMALYLLNEYDLKHVLVTLSFAPNVNDFFNIEVDSFNELPLYIEKEAVQKLDTFFPKEQASVIKMLDLSGISYFDVTKMGAFGCFCFPWEKYKVLVG